MQKSGLSTSDHARLSEAIKSAEATTAGEIFVVVARRSDDYIYPAAFFLTLGAALASILVALGLEWLWINPRLPVFVAAQAAALGSAIAAAVFLSKIRIHLVPHRLRYRRAHANAVTQFQSRNVHRTAERTGVLIFVSLDEKYAEIIADSGINTHVAQDVWTAIVARLVAEASAGRLCEGLEAAIRDAGALLARHVPPRPGDRNELDDHVVEI